MFLSSSLSRRGGRASMRVRTCAEGGMHTLSFFRWPSLPRASRPAHPDRIPLARRGLLGRLARGRETSRGRWGLEASQIDLSVGRRMAGWGIPQSERRRGDGQAPGDGFQRGKRILGRARRARRKGKRGRGMGRRPFAPLPGDGSSATRVTGGESAVWE